MEQVRYQVSHQVICPFGGTYTVEEFIEELWSSYAQAGLADSEIQSLENSVSCGNGKLFFEGKIIGREV